MSRTPRWARRAVEPGSIPKWLFGWLLYLTVRVEVLTLTDDADREWIAEQLPAAILWIANNGTHILVAVGILGTAFVTFRQRVQNERRND